MTWFWSKPSSLISHHFATKWYICSTSNPFPHFLPMISRDDHPPCLKKCQTSLDSMRSYTYQVILIDIAIRDPRFVHMRIAAASIWEQRLFRSACPDMRRQFESGVWSSKYGTYIHIYMHTCSIIIHTHINFDHKYYWCSRSKFPFTQANRLTQMFPGNIPPILLHLVTSSVLWLSLLSLQWWRWRRGFSPS